MKKSLLLLLFLISVTFVSCFEDQDDTVTPATASEINDFIYRGLNFFYLYKSETPELANDYFASDEAYQAFLNSYDTPESFFDYLMAPQDRFSRLYDDYVVLENALAGNSLNNGMEFGLVFYPGEGEDRIFGYIRYVLPNTDAEAEGLERGMIFNTIDGEQLTESNYNELLTPDTYTIGLATFDGTNIVATGESVELTKTQYTENPIFETKTFTINGQKIGYLMYNAFTSDFDSQLNSVFGQFKSEGVTDLVLDLRYNGGGSVLTATYLASMITGQFTSQVFYKEQWNEDRQSDYAQDGVFLDNFQDNSETINSLNLSKVYILTGPRTASASELVINGLAPYIEVVQIGTNTTGKYQASFLLYDAPAPNFRRAEANPDHTYAMLPLVFQTANANDNTGYDNGLTPNIDQPEDYSNLGILGNENEPLLATALSEITGMPMPTRSGMFFLETVSESKALQPVYQIMYVKGTK